MDTECFIKNYEEDDLLEIMFAWNGKHAEGFVDTNMEFRRKVLEIFKTNKNIFSIHLVSALYEAETEFAREAWGVNPVVSELAQALLEKGRTLYVTEYLKGLGRGMDSYIQSLEIELSLDCINELIDYCHSRKTDDSFPNKEQASILLELLVHKRDNLH